MTDKELQILIRARNQARAEFAKVKADLRDLAREAAKVGAAMSGAGPNGNAQTQTKAMTDAARQQTRVIQDSLKQQNEARRAAGEQALATDKRFSEARIASALSDSKRAVGAIEAGAAQEVAARRQSSAAVADLTRSEGAERVKAIQQQSAASLAAIQNGSHAELAATEAATRAQLATRMDGIRQEADLQKMLVDERLASVHRGVAEELSAQRSALAEKLSVESAAQRQQIAAIQSLSRARIDEVARSTDAEIRALQNAAKQELGIRRSAMEAQQQALAGLRRQDQADIQAKYNEDLAALRAHHAQMGEVGAAAIAGQEAKLAGARDIALANSRKNYDLETEAVRGAYTERVAIIEAGVAAESAARQAAGREAVALQESIGRQLTETTRRASEMQAAEIRRGMTAQMATLHDSSREWEQVSDSLFMAGATLSTAVTAPIVLGTKAVVSFGSSFEDAMAGVAKTSFDASLSTEQNAANVERLGDAFVAMSTRIPASREEIAKVAEIAGQLGISGTDNILKFTESVIRMSESSNLSIEDAADGMARLANVMALPTSEIDHLGSTIAGLGIRFAATESDILSMSFRIAAAGKQAGFTNAEVLGLSAALSSMGLKAEQGGSAVSRVLKDITKWVELGTPELEKLAQVAGLTAQEFADAWRDDPQQALVAFLEGLNRAGQSGADALQFLDDVALDGIRVSDVLLRASGNAGLVASALEMSNPIWAENNELVRISENRFQTLSAQWQMAKNEISAVALELYDRLRPALIAVVHGLADVGRFLVAVVGWFAGLPTPVLALVGAFIAVAAAVGPLLIMLGGLASLFAAMAVSGAILSVVIPPIAGTLLVVAAAVAAVIAGVTLLIVYWDELTSLMPNTVGLISSLVDSLGGLGPILSVIGQALVFAFAMALGPIALVVTAVDSLIGALDNLIGWLGQVAAAAPGAFGDLLGWVDKATLGLTGFLGGAVLGAVPGAVQVVAIGKAVKETTEAIIDQTDKTEAAAKSVQNLTSVQQQYVDLQDDAITQTREYQDVFARMLEARKDDLKDSKARGTILAEIGVAAASAAREQLGLNTTYDQGNLAVAAYFAGLAKVHDQMASGFQQRGRMIAEIKHEASEVHSLQNAYVEMAGAIKAAFVGATLEELPDLINAALLAVQRDATDMFSVNKMLQSTGLAQEQVLDALIAKRRELQIATLQLDPNLKDEQVQIAQNTAQMALLDEAIRRATEGAYGYAHAIANADTVHMAFDTVKQSLQQQEQYWTGLGEEAEKYRDQLIEIRDNGGILTPEQEHQLENFEWLIGRSAGALKDDLAPAQRAVVSAQADWIKKLDELNAKRSEIGDEEYNKQLVELAKTFNGALDPAGNLTTSLTILTDAINNLARAIGGLPAEFPLPEEINTKVNLETADFDHNMAVTRDEAMDFANTPISNEVGANVEPARGQYQEATRFWQEYANSNPTTTVDADITNAIGKFIVIQEAVKRYVEAAPETPAILNTVPFMEGYGTVWQKLQDYINSNPTATLYANDQASGTVDALAAKLQTLVNREWSVLVSVGYNDPGFSPYGPGDTIPAPGSGGGVSSGGGSTKTLQGLGSGKSLAGLPTPETMEATTKVVPTKLVDLAAQQTQNAQDYVSFIQDTVKLLAQAAESMGEEGQEAARDFAETAKTAFEALLAAWEFLQAVGDETLVLAENHHASIEAINHALYKIVALMSQNAESISGDYLAGGKLFAEAAQSGASAFAAGLEFLTALDEQNLTLTEAHHATLEAVNHLLYAIVKLVSQNAESLAGPGLEAGKAFAEAASSMVGLMSAALDFFIKLDQATQDGVAIMTDINSVVVVLASRSKLIVDALLAIAPLWEEEVPTQLQRFHDGVESSVGALTAVIDLFSALQQAAEDGVDLGDDINSAVVVLSTRARLIADAFLAVTPVWEDEVAPGMQAFADGVAAATGGLTSVLDLLTRLLDLTTELDLSHDDLARIAVNLAAKATIVAEAFRAVVPAWTAEDGVATAIGDFSNAVSDSNGALSSTLEFLADLAGLTNQLDLSEAEVQAAAEQLASRARIIAEAFGAASDTWVAEAHPNLVKFSEAASASLDAVSKVGEALKAIIEFGVAGGIGDLAGRASHISDFVVLIVSEIEEASEHWQEGIAEIGQFAEDAGKAVELISSVADAMTAISEVSAISLRQAQIFVDNFKVMLTLVRGLSRLAQGYLADALSFQQVAEAIAASLSAAADAMTAITGEPASGGSSGGTGGTGGTGGSRAVGGPITSASKAVETARQFIQALADMQAADAAFATLVSTGGLQMFGASFETLAEHMDQALPKIIASGQAGIDALVAAIAAGAVDLSTVMESAVNLTDEQVAKLTAALEGTAGGAGRDSGLRGISDGGGRNANTPWQKLGAAIPGDISAGIDFGTPEALDTLDGLNADIQATIPAFEEPWPEVGTHISHGLAKGIADGESAVIKAAVGVAKAALKAAKDELGIASPSKRARELGRWLALGFAEGISDQAGRVARASLDLGRGALASIDAAVKAFRSTAENGDVVGDIRESLAEQIGRIVSATDRRQHFGGPDIPQKLLEQTAQRVKDALAAGLDRDALNSALAEQMQALADGITQAILKGDSAQRAELEKQMAILLKLLNELGISVEQVKQAAAGDTSGTGGASPAALSPADQQAVLAQFRFMRSIREERARIPAGGSLLKQAVGNGTVLNVSVTMDGKVVASTVSKQMQSGSTLNVELV